MHIIGILLMMSGRDVSFVRLSERKSVFSREKKKIFPVREGARREECENEKEGGRGGGAPAGAAVRQRAP